MKTMKNFLLIAALWLLAGSTMFASDGAWLTNLDDAMKVAKAENKALLVDFSGSDWCGWCIKLDEEVCSKEEFQKEASKDFVLCIIDWRRKTEMPAEEAAHSEAMRTKYEVQGFPTLLIIDTDGVPMHKLSTSYKDGVEGVLKKAQDGLKEGRAAKKICDDSAIVIKSASPNDAKTIAAAKSLVANLEFPSFYKEAMDVVEQIAKDDNSDGLKEALTVMDLKNIRFPNQRNLTQYTVIIESLESMENTTDNTKKLVAVGKAIIAKTNGDTEAAQAAIAGAEGLEDYFGVALSDITAWINK